MTAPIHKEHKCHSFCHHNNDNNAISTQTEKMNVSESKLSETEGRRQKSRKQSKLLHTLSHVRAAAIESMS